MADAGETGGSGAQEALLRRTALLLEEGRWKEAGERVSEILDSDPEYAQAYVAQLMAELHVKTREGLAEVPCDYSRRPCYMNALRFGDDALKAELGEMAQKARRLGKKRRKKVTVAAILALLVVVVVAALAVAAFSHANSPAGRLEAAAVGDTVTLGSYEQDGDVSDGAEPIEWVVLAKEDGRALLLSKYALDCSPYSDAFDGVTWATCDLRSWLNGGFYEAAFSAGEQALVAESDLTNPDNEGCGTSGGADTQDRVFLLSIDEVGQYLPTDEERVCLPTAQAVANGVWTDGDTGACGWWLRSPGRDSRLAAAVGPDGSVSSIGCHVDAGDGAVRPALWVNL